MAITLREYTDLIEKVRKSGLGRAVKRSLIRIALVAEARAKRNVTAGGKSGLNRRSNALFNSIQGTVRQAQRALGDVEAVVSADTPYARIHELGGTVRPQTAQYLTIPLQAAKTAGGDVRGSARDFDLFVLRFGGRLWLMRDDGDRLTPFFLLVRQVTIPKRPYLAPAMQTAAKGLRDALASEIRKEMAHE